MDLISLLILVGFYGIGLAVFATCRARPALFLFICGFAIPMMGFNHTFAGINVTWPAYIGPLALILLPLAPRRFWQAVRDVRLQRLLVYSILVTCIWMIFEYGFLHRYIQAKLIGLGPGQTIFKMPVQLFGFVFPVLSYYIIPTRAVSTRDVRAGMFGFIAGCITSFFAGIILYLASGRGYLRDPRGERLDAGLEAFIRIGGLSGEPKNLAACLVLGLTLVAALYAYEPLRYHRRKLLRWFVILAVALIATFSTSGWLAFGLAFTALVLVTRLWNRRANQALFWKATLTVFVLVSFTPFGATIYEQRVSQRLFDPESSEVGEQKENYVFDVYKDKPYHLAWGFGLGGLDLEATQFLFNDYRYHKQLYFTRTPTPSLNGMRLWGDLGLGGLLLFALLVLSWVRQLRRLNEHGLAAFVLCGAIGLLFIPFNGIGAYFFLCGGAMTVARLKENRCENQSRTPLYSSNTSVAS